MIRAIILASLILVACPAWGEVLLQEDFEDVNLPQRGWWDISQWGADKGLYIAGEPEVTPRTGKGCLRIRYTKGNTGGWAAHKLRGVKEFYCRYYRFFPEGWEWPQGYGPHDSYVMAGYKGAPTNTDATIYLDFWKSADTLMRVATCQQKWGYNGYADVLRKYGGNRGQTPQNMARPEKVQLGKWHCVEYYARLSDAGKENGELKLWVNGKLVSDLPGLPLVDEKHGGTLFDQFLFGPYYHNGSPKEQRCYLDSLVISTEYIGTLEQKGNQPPMARFTQSRPWGSMEASFDAGRSMDPDGKIVSYAWDFGDGTSGQGVNVKHGYAKAGDYTVALTVTDDKGETHARTLPISVGPEVGCGNGLKGEYFDGEKLDSASAPPAPEGHPELTPLQSPAVRVERRLFFEQNGWDGRYLNSRAGSENGHFISCRWTGFVQAKNSEEYTLSLDCRDGGRVWFDGKLIIDAWDKPGVNSAAVGKLEAGKKYPIRVEFHKGAFQGTRDWWVRLFWQSPSTPKEPIPAPQLYLPEGFQTPDIPL